MRTRNCIIGLFAFILLLISTRLAAQTGELEGYVGCIEGPPIVGAIVTLGGIYSDTTDNSGYFYIADIPIGVYSMTIIKEGYNFPVSEVIIEELSTFVEVIILCGGFTVYPLNIEVILEPNAQTTEIITLSNTSGSSVEWNAELEIFPPANTKDFLDVQFQYPVTGANSHVGIECDGTYFYITDPYSGVISKYSWDGTFIETFTMVTGLRDLAFDGTYFYGGNGSITIYQMDFYMQVLVSTFTAPGNVRAIAYNHNEDIFYGYSWGGDIIAFDLSGALIAIAPVGPSGANYSGFAYDNVTEGGPYLWGYGLVGTDPNTLVQIELPALQETGLIVSLSEILPEPLTNSAGGLFSHPDIIPGTWTLGGVVMDEWIWGLELAEYQTWISIEPISGVLEAGETEEMTVYFDATDLFPWTYEAEIQFSTLPNVGSPVVDVSMIIEGEPWVQNLQTEISCTNIILNWETVPPSMPADSFHVYRDSLWLATTFDTHFVDSLVFPEIEYTYYATGYFYNGWESYPTNTVNVTVPIPDDLEPNLEVTIINDSILCFYWGTNACLLPETYNLYRDWELIAVLTEPSYCDTLPIPGFFEYYITATYYFGESGPSDTYYYLWVDVSNVTYEKEIRIYPNPVNDKLFIESPTSIIQIELLNIQGSTVFSENIFSKDYQINVSSLDPGIYFLKLETSEGIIRRKLVVK